MNQRRGGKDKHFGSWQAGEMEGNGFRPNKTDAFDSNTVAVYNGPMHEVQTLESLAAAVNAWCADHRVVPANAQAGELVTERNIRFYRTTGLVDAPDGGGYGEKHFLQLVAIRLLQAQGLPLRRIRELLFGRSIAELREVQKRGVVEAKTIAAARTPMPASDELWRMIPLDDDFLIVSRRGTTISPEQREALIRALRTPQKTTKTKEHP